MAKIIAVAVISCVSLGMAAWALSSRASDAPVHRPVAVFLGDSYTVGVGSDGPDWPTTVSAQLGWDAVNLAAGGTGYATEAGMKGCGKEHCGTYLEQSKSIVGVPDIIVIAGGRNDRSSVIAEGARKLFTALRAEYPDTRIIALSPWTDDDPMNEVVEAKITAVQKAAESAGITYVDTGQPFVGHSDLISADGVHPNSAGYAKLSALLTPMLAKATGRPVPVTTPETATVLTIREEQVRTALRATSWPELTPAADQLGDGALVPEWVKDHCLDVSDANVDACAYGDADADETIALLGDEQAIGYMPTLRTAFPDRRIQSLTLQRCPAAAVQVQTRTASGLSRYAECDAHRRWVSEWLTEHKPQTVVVVDTWNTPMRMTADDTVSALREYKTALTGLLSQLTALDAEVIVLAAPPPGYALTECRTATSTPSDCVRTAPREYSDWTRILTDAASPFKTADFVRSDRWLCAARSCPAFVDGVITFADGTHLTDAAARALAPLLVQATAQQ
ncbi:SGNH hydrolase domain-containing protein [Microbacterium suwonense]|uniref:SGNH hydrolase-type esterase domain-containing protein n=1 Tax=Microbacterium suwonense TaxID=683047 RepID=A0ABN6X553_9MICO|nr:SGNH hydrolase domain-containing protein [Microbacterium suwonense]BDZ39248.1 hypothetical protein GCM10025863_18620 [Microbacterium suwonense]